MLGATRSYARLRCALRGNVPVRRAQQRVAGLKKWRATVLLALAMYTLLILCGRSFTVKKQNQEQKKDLTVTMCQPTKPHVHRLFCRPALPKPKLFLSSK